MLSLSRYFLPALAVLISSIPVYAETAWTEGVSQNCGWFDVNKNWKTDKSHCWVASAANIIAWWQEKIGKEKIPEGTPQGVEAIFAAISDAFIDSGRGSDIAWKWYFGGCDLVEFNYMRDFRNPETARTSGRFWEKNILRKYGWAEPRDGVPVYIESGFAVDFSPDKRHAEELAETFVRLFGEGKGVILNLSPSGAFPMGHAITLWGIEYQKNRIKSVYVTDSDDRSEGLKKYDVAYVTTKETMGDGKKDGMPITTWEKTSIRLRNYCGSNQYGIQNWAALGFPEPEKSSVPKKTSSGAKP